MVTGIVGKGVHAYCCMHSQNSTEIEGFARLCLIAAIAAMLQLVSAGFDNTKYKLGDDERRVESEYEN